MTFFDQLGHFTIKEGHQQARDMGAVHVGVGHDDNLLVAQLSFVEFIANAAAQGLDQIL